ncbi:MAG: regulatory protein RecX [Candidatus Bipolaricaulia bacterium]
MPRSEDEPEEARKYLLRLLRYRPRSRAEALDRLRRRGYSAETIAQTLAWAEEAGLLDDALFAKLWIAERLEHRPCGKILLRRELIERGIPPEIIEEALERAGLNEEELARGLAKERSARYRNLPAEEQRAKLLALLSRRGFPASLCARVLHELTSGSIPLGP